MQGVTAIVVVQGVDFTATVVVQGVDPEHRGVRGVPHPPPGCAPHHSHHHVSHSNSTPRKTPKGDKKKINS